MADAAVSKTVEATRASSTLASGTIHSKSHSNPIIISELHVYVLFMLRAS
jgi:hypothetical protein